MRQHALDFQKLVFVLLTEFFGARQTQVVIELLPALQIVFDLDDLVLSTFQAAREAGIPLTELIADYAALKLTARELRGGAIIFLAPRSLGQK